MSYGYKSKIDLRRRERGIKHCAICLRTLNKFGECSEHGTVDLVLTTTTYAVHPSIRAAVLATSTEPVRKPCKSCGQEFEAKQPHHQYCPTCLPAYAKR